MTLIARYHHPRLAQGAVDYFKTQGVECVLRSTDGQNVEVWLQHGDVERAQQLWQEFLAEPTAKRYLEASWQTGSTEGLFRYPGEKLNLLQRLFALNWLLQGVFGISLIIFIAMFFGDARSIFDNLRFAPEQPLTWLAPTVIHFSAIHLIFNLSWWLYLGAQVSARLGLGALIAVYVSSGLISNFMQFWLVDANFGGLSGVVYGLLGFCWIYSHRHPKQPALIAKPVVGFMLLWMLFGFTELFFISMANWAHLFGLLSGMAMAALWPKSKDEPSQPAP